MSAMQSLSPQHLWGRYLDILLLGGASLVVLPLLLLAGRVPETADTLIGFAFVMAGVINHPHFAHSYVIFYRQFGEVLSGRMAVGRFMYLKFAVVAFGVPLLLFSYIAVNIFVENWTGLGLIANVMFLLVGWHYAKQGFGMLMLDASFKHSFLLAVERKFVLANAYLCWALAWVKANMYLRTGSYFGVTYYTFEIPAWIERSFSILVIVSTLLAFFMIFRVILRNPPKMWPVAGIVGYFASLYPWLIFSSPFLIFFIPFFHSLQYLAVTSRFELNYLRQKTSFVRLFLRFGLVSAVCVGMGYVGFYLVPAFLDGRLNGVDEKMAIGTFSCWIFINIHHYFIDNVIWKRGNPQLSRCLFQTRDTVASS